MDNVDQLIRVTRTHLEEKMSMSARFAATAVVASLLSLPVASARELDDRDLTRLTVTQAARLIRDGEVSSTRLTRALLEKIRANRDLNATPVRRSAGKHRARHCGRSDSPCVP